MSESGGRSRRLRIRNWLSWARGDGVLRMWRLFLDMCSRKLMPERHRMRCCAVMRARKGRCCWVLGSRVVMLLLLLLLESRMWR